jgi:hypothetical protein
MTEIVVSVAALTLLGRKIGIARSSGGLSTFFRAMSTD